MLVSVVVCTHRTDHYEEVTRAVDSLLKQTHPEIEIIVVVDGVEESYQKMILHYGSQSHIRVIATERSLGAFGAANVGVKAARGEIVAFMDDDAIAERTWVENLIDAYREFDAIAVGGKILPVWCFGRPDYLPEEMDWLVGVTHEGFAEENAVEVRNTFGPNMSFRREVFERIGLFNEELAFAPPFYIQGAEADFGWRMKQELGKGVIYNPEAVVYHQVSQSKVKVRALLKRAFCQGYSKALLRRLNPSGGVLTVERSYLKRLLMKNIPRRIKGCFSRLDRATEIKKLSFLIALILSITIGFLYGYVRRG